MFFAPAIQKAAELPSPAPAEFGLQRFLRDASTGFGMLSPGYSLSEDDQSWTLEIDVPGVAREHLQVSVDRNAVQLSTSQESKRQFNLAFTMPREINAEGCQAQLVDGVLKLKLAKSQPVRQIQIN